MTTEPSRERGLFTTTLWSVVLRAGAGGSEESFAALGRLCQCYWYPLYVFVRHQGNSPAEAEDLTQAFFERMIGKNYLQQADPAKGRFRAFLLASLKHFLADRRDHARAIKRGGGRLIVSWDAHTAEERYQHEPHDGWSPEIHFDQAWATEVLARARAQLRIECVTSGKVALFDALYKGEKGTVLSHVEIAERLGLTESAVKAASHRLRQRFQRIVRDEISETVGTREEVDEEIRYLLTLMTKG